MFDALRDRIEDIKAAPARALPRAAARIEAELRKAATTRRGNVPEPISAEPTSSGIVITAPDWVLRRARENGQPAHWKEILRAELRKATR